MEQFMSVVFFGAPVFLTISSIILSIKCLKIRDTILSGIFLINALLPIFVVASVVASFVSNLQKETITLILSINILVCILSIIVIFALPFLQNDRKLILKVENSKAFIIWCVSLVLYLLINIVFYSLISTPWLF
tara:strand:+ start:155 stop:556 length:402 start_codon:yes stop_codon:yes gene_type:complete